LHISTIDNHMRKLSIFLFFWIPGVAIAGQTCDRSLEWLMEQYVEARGGHEALGQQRALRIESTNHEGEWNPHFDYRVMKPGFMWIEAVYDDGEVIIEGFDGERGWEKWGDKPAQYVSGAAGRALHQGAQSPVHLYGLHHMEGLGADVEFRSCDELDGRNFYVVNVRSRFGTDIDYYLATETFLLERSRTVRPLHPTVDPTPITIEERWTDFRAVDGVLHPYGFSLINVDTGEVLSWLEVHSISRDPDLREESFRRPD
jgi:hypothetical protein